MLPLETPLPRPELRHPDGALFDWASLDNRPLAVAFLCNHCPFVQHVLPVFSSLTRNFAGSIQFVAINSNDEVHFPQDGPVEMQRLKEREDWTFPFLFDGSQEAAKAFQAACTPDFFLFGKNGTLVYRGQFDQSRPGNGIAVTGSDFRLAIENELLGNAPLMNQLPSLGCNIKWKPGNEPDYFGSRP